MDPRHRDFLEKCHRNLAESVTDADQLVEVLSRGGTLSPAERHELARGAGGREKVELLVKILLRKDRDHFADFCSALEETNPHLRAVLLAGPGMPSAGSTYSVLSAMPSDSESSGSLSSVGTATPASSPPPAHVDGHQLNEKMEGVLLQLRHVSRERDELRKRLALSSPGSTFDDCRPDSRAGHDYERLKLQCMKAMAELQSLQNQHSGTLKRCEEAVKKADFYHTLHSRLAAEHGQLKDELEALRLDNAGLIREHEHAKRTCEELRRLREHDRREAADVRALHQQVIREGSSDALHKLYDSAVDKLESVRCDYEGLRKLYEDATAGRNADLSRLERAEDEKRRLQKQLDVLMKQRDAAIHYQQQYSSSVRRLDQQELTKAAAHNVELQREMERLQSEATRSKTQQLKAAKDCEKYKEERDSVMGEYRLIMSERDQVIKEVERLQTGLELAQAKLKNTSSERRVASEELEALRQELSSSLMERDRAVCEKSELLEKYCHEVKDKAEAQKELNQACKDVETVREERDVARKERTEAIIQRDQLLREYYQARQKQDSASLDVERANKEMETLRKQYEAVGQELKEALQEAEVAKCRRDWAFQERDKIVGERESVRTLCDNLRRERDRAVSDLADALRNLDDTRKQKNDVVRELKELKEKMEDQLEKEARFRQLMAHSSHDSAIDMDSVEWETEVVEFDKCWDMDLNALGFDIAEGLNDPYLPGDCGVFISKVDKGSLAEGRLRVNDWLLKINNVDLTSKDRKQAIKAVLSGQGVINMVVRRRKSLGGRVATPVQINLAGHKDCGICLESGVFVASLAPGSPAARDNALTVGDRLLAINGVSVDTKSLPECDALLRTCRESLCISLARFFPQSCSGHGLYDSLRDSEKVSKNCGNSKHNCPTQADGCACEMRCRFGGGGDVDGAPGEAELRCHHVPDDFLHSRSPSEPLAEFSYGRQDFHRRPFTFTPVHPDCGPPSEKAGGGTWPKVIAGPSVPECAQLSIYKRSKQRKSIFDTNTFRRPEAPAKLDYVPLSQLPKDSPQSSLGESSQAPPTPPARSDSFRFKHSQQNSSASDSAIPAEPSRGSSPVVESECAKLLYYTAEAAQRESKLLADDDGSQRCLQPEKRRYRPKSAPALRRNVTPLHIPVPMQVHNFSNDEHSPEPMDLLRFSPMRNNRYSMHFGPPSYSSGVAHPVQRGLAKTAVMRNPVYAAWSHEVQTANSLPGPSSGVLAHSRANPQHHGRHSVDLNHKLAGDVGDSSRVPHGTNSLPSGSRLGSLSAFQFRAERIRIPVTRYPGSAGWDRGSRSRSECSSPTTPPESPVGPDALPFSGNQSASSVSTRLRISVSPAATGDGRKDGPYLEEPRNVTVQKGAEPLGISIVSGDNGGVFVSKVTAGSIAHQARLEFGDQLLEFNGINLRNANEQQARLVIGQQCDTVTILAQYNPHMFQLGNHSRSSSRMESIGNQPTRHDSGAATPDDSSAGDALSEQDEGTVTPPSEQTTPAASPHRLPVVGLRRTAESRLVRLKRIQAELGVQICGGNLYGVFVESLDEDSPAKSAEGLLPGDLILEYNGVSMKNKTKEEAYLELLKPAETVTFKVQNRLDELAAVKEKPGDGIFIRSLYERVAESEQELSFNKDDILYVEDTLPNGNFGYWTAWHLDEKGQKLEKGQIPSKFMVDQEFYRRHGTSDTKDDGSGGKSLSAAARRSFFRRRLKHKRSGSKDGKDLMASETVMSDYLPITEDGVSFMYQRVQKVECSAPRPVLILGPLAETSKDMLVNEAPAKFSRCLPEVMKASQQAIERGVKDCVFIDYKRRSGHFDVTTVASIKEITEKDAKHCLLDIAAHAIERLHSVHIYPIVIFIRYKNAKQIKEQKDPTYLRDKLSQKLSKEHFEAAQKTEQDYGRFFTGVVQGGSVSFICTQIVTIVEQEQNKVLWIPDGVQ
ncbi:disks large homolog 5-like [Syngnathoides biaculeatus]|uniref:disks large homolog 5-like n=1 Tax=Syngnathoides biaculeatus TaxID=300417 RepID=UPI002ADE8B6C|nr:disks large homolog 5-like [Syngnathoides biaculeatus]